MTLLTIHYLIFYSAKNAMKIMTVKQGNGRIDTNIEDNLYTFNHYSFMSSCILCNEELKSPCEELFGVCKKDAPKVKQILSVAMSMGGFGK